MRILRLASSAGGLGCGNGNGRTNADFSINSRSLNTAMPLKIAVKNLFKLSAEISQLPPSPFASHPLEGELQNCVCGMSGRSSGLPPGQPWRPHHGPWCQRVSGSCKPNLHGRSRRNITNATIYKKQSNHSLVRSLMIPFRGQQRDSMAPTGGMRKPEMDASN
jgi:hypothetical protein